MRRIALAGVVASAGIIMTGAAVRLSQSGLGCPDWPACTAHSIVAGGTSGSSLVHRWIEFGNRLLTGAILVISVLVAVAASRFRPGGSRRRDVVVLGFTQPAGIVAQAVIGGVVVLTKLDPVWVSIHFLLSISLVAAAVALHVRVTEGAGPARPLVRGDLRMLAAAVVAVVVAMLAAGTVVTGTGPLAGARSVARYHLPLAGVTQLHADIGWLITGLVLALVAGLRFSDAPRRAMRLGWVLQRAAGRPRLGARHWRGADLDHGAAADVRAAGPGPPDGTGNRPRRRPGRGPSPGCLTPPAAGPDG